MSGLIKRKKLLKDINFLKIGIRQNQIFSLRKNKNIKINLKLNFENLMNDYNDENNENNRPIFRKAYELPKQEEDLDHYMSLLSIFSIVYIS